MNDLLAAAEPVDCTDEHYNLDDVLEEFGNPMIDPAKDWLLVRLDDQVVGEVAAQHFDVVIVREDEALRGRERGEVAGFVVEGVRPAVDAGARCKQVEMVLEEIEAVRHAMARANAGDLMVLCVDKHGAVMTELEQWSSQAQAGVSRKLRSRIRPTRPRPTPDGTPSASAV